MTTQLCKLISEDFFWYVCIGGASHVCCHVTYKLDFPAAHVSDMLPTFSTQRHKVCVGLTGAGQDTCARSLTGWTIYKATWIRLTWMVLQPILSCPSTFPLSSSNEVTCQTFVKLICQGSKLEPCGPPYDNLWGRLISLPFSVCLCPGIPNKMSRKAQFSDGIMQQIEQNCESRRSINSIIKNIKISRSLCF